MSDSWAVSPVSLSRAKKYILEMHYARRMPSVSHCYGLFDTHELRGIVSYGVPPSPPLVRGICGAEWASHVIELNRLCLDSDAASNMASFLIAHSIAMLQRPSIVVAYADTSMGHVGYVYQASNFLYTGLSDAHKDWVDNINPRMHSRHVARIHTLPERLSDSDRFRQIDRPRKHRYVLFTGSRKEKRMLEQDLQYPVQPYPKGSTQRYSIARPQIEQKEMALGF